MMTDHSAEGPSPAFLELLEAEPLGELTVLDVGTGAGRLALVLAPRARGEVGAKRLLKKCGSAVDTLTGEREVAQFETVEQGLAGAVALREKWKQDGRWFRYVKFLEEGGRTQTRARLVVKARKA